MAPQAKPYICPVCRAPRFRQLSERVPAGIHVALALAVGTLVLTAYLLAGFENAWRMAFLYLPLWAAAEFVHGMRMRKALLCPACGFDPVLYIKDRGAARAEVEKRLNQVAETLKPKADEKANEKKAAPPPGRPTPRP